MLRTGSPRQADVSCSVSRSLYSLREALKKYSIETLPAVMEHLEMAKEQYAMLTLGADKPR